MNAVTSSAQRYISDSPLQGVPTFDKFDRPSSLTCVVPASLAFRSKPDIAREQHVRRCCFLLAAIGSADQIWLAGCWHDAAPSEPLNTEGRKERDVYDSETGAEIPAHYARFKEHAGRDEKFKSHLNKLSKGRKREQRTRVGGIAWGKSRGREWCSL